MSINDPEFPLTQFVSEEDAEAVVAKVNEIGTRRLRLLKSEFETLVLFSTSSHFRCADGRESTNGYSQNIKREIRF